MTEADLSGDRSDWIDSDDFDQKEYDNTVSNRIKQGWIFIQATMMTMYMIIGIRNYNKLTPGMTKVKALFLGQFFIIIYLIVNELTHRHMNGIFIILLFTQYSLFLTFCIIVDSMLTTQQLDEARNSKLRTFNKTFRICVHLMTAGLFVSTFFMADCDT